jgi:hypothetical protein
MTFILEDLSDPRFFIPWRLSGLLSGYLPTDTRPQARAKLGKTAIKWFDSASQHFFWVGANFLQHQAASLLSCHVIGVENERMLKFMNEVSAPRESGEQ